MYYSSETQVFLYVKSDVLDEAGVFLAFMGAAVWESCRRVYQPTQICSPTQSSASRLSGRDQEREFRRLDSQAEAPPCTSERPLTQLTLRNSSKQSGGEIYVFHTAAQTFQCTRNTRARVCCRGVVTSDSPLCCSPLCSAWSFELLLLQPRNKRTETVGRRRCESGSACTCSS